MTPAKYYKKKSKIVNSELSDSKKEFEKYALWVEYVSTATQKSKYE